MRASYIRGILLAEVYFLFDGRERKERKERQKGSPTIRYEFSGELLVSSINRWRSQPPTIEKIESSRRSLETQIQTVMTRAFNCHNS